MRSWIWQGRPEHSSRRRPARCCSALGKSHFRSQLRPFTSTSPQQNENTPLFTKSENPGGKQRVEGFAMNLTCQEREFNTKLPECCIWKPRFQPGPAGQPWANTPDGFSDLPRNSCTALRLPSTTYRSIRPWTRELLRAMESSLRKRRSWCWYSSQAWEKNWKAVF